MNTTPDPAFSPNPPERRLPEAAPDAPVVIPVIAETAVVTREVVESGRVHIAKTVHEQDEIINLQLQHEEVQVERVPINQFVDEAAPPTTRYEGDTMIIPVLREVVVKRLVLVEELHVVKRQITTQQSQPVRLRHEELHVTRLAPDGTPVTTPNSPEPPAPLV